MTVRPACPVCGSPVDTLCQSPGVYAAYPCTHWLTEHQAAPLAARRPVAPDRRHIIHARIRPQGA